MNCENLVVGYLELAVQSGASASLVGSLGLLEWMILVWNLFSTDGNEAWDLDRDITQTRYTDWWKGDAGKSAVEEPVDQIT